MDIDKGNSPFNWQQIVAEFEKREEEERQKWQADKAWDNAKYDLYGDLPENVKWELKNAIDRAAERLSNSGQTRAINLLDYGCGDGRYVEFLEQVAKEKHLHINCYSYDISSGKLSDYEKRLADNHFKMLDISGSLPIKAESRIGHVGPVYTKAAKDSSITVHLLRGQFADLPLPQQVKRNLIGNHVELDLTFPVFGVLSYMPGEYRRATLKGLREITDGEILASVPTFNREPNAYARDNFMREKHREFLARNNNDDANKIAAYLRGATEPGDTFILFPNKKGGYDEHFYHLFTQEQFEQEVKDAGFISPDFRTVNVLPEATITQAPIDNMADEIRASRLDPKKLDQEGAMFIMVHDGSKRQKEHEQAAYSALKDSYKTGDREPWTKRHAHKSEATALTLG